MVAVVGARAASRQGLAIAAAIGAELAAAGVVVVSGLARGIDTAAHRAALDAGGLQHRRPRVGTRQASIRPSTRGWPARSPRAARWSANAARDAPPLPHHFPLRNRIISGLAAATVVVEASEKSGSLITAAAALDQGREVMAVPGPVAPGRHRGAHALLRDGATLVERADDVMAALGWATPAGVAGGPALDPPWPRNSASIPTTDEFDADDVCGRHRLAAAHACATAGRPRDRRRDPAIGGGRFVGSRNRVLT